MQQQTKFRATRAVPDDDVPLLELDMAGVPMTPVLDQESSRAGNAGHHEGSRSQPHGASSGTRAGRESTTQAWIESNPVSAQRRFLWVTKSENTPYDLNALESNQTQARIRARSAAAAQQGHAEQTAVVDADPISKMTQQLTTPRALAAAPVHSRDDGTVVRTAQADAFADVNVHAHDTDVIACPTISKAFMIKHQSVTGTGADLPFPSLTQAHERLVETDNLCRDWHQETTSRSLVDVLAFVETSLFPEETVLATLRLSTIANPPWQQDPTESVYTGDGWLVLTSRPSHGGAPPHRRLMFLQTSVNRRGAGPTTPSNASYPCHRYVGSESHSRDADAAPGYRDQQPLRHTSFNSRHAARHTSMSAMTIISVEEGLLGVSASFIDTSEVVSYAQGDTSKPVRAAAHEAVALQRSAYRHGVDLVYPNNGGRVNTHPPGSRTVTVTKRVGDGFGMVISKKTGHEVTVKKSTGVAWKAGIRKGDTVAEVNRQPVATLTQQQVVAICKQSATQVELVVNERSEDDSCCPCWTSCCCPPPPPPEPPRPGDSATWKFDSEKATNYQGAVVSEAAAPLRVQSIGTSFNHKTHPAVSIKQTRYAAKLHTVSMVLGELDANSRHVVAVIDPNEDANAVFRFVSLATPTGSKVVPASYQNSPLHKALENYLIYNASQRSDAIVSNQPLLPFSPDEKARRPRP